MMTRSVSLQTNWNERPGAVLVCVLVCMLVAMALVTTMTRSALRCRREVRFEHQLAQTEFLLDAGIHRAARQLGKSDDYQGESWRPAQAITRFDSPLVEIQVSTDANQAGRKLVQVTASLGVSVKDADQIHASLTRRTHSFTFETLDSTRSNAE